MIFFENARKMLICAVLSRRLYRCRRQEQTATATTTMAHNYYIRNGIVHIQSIKHK